MANDVALEVYYDGSWHDLIADDRVFVEQELTIQRGDGEESSALRPASLVARLNNDDDLLRVSNPESPLYGKVGRNTPVRVSVGGVVRFIGEAASWVTGQTRDFRRFPKRGKAWVDLEAGGLLQRVGQWTEPLRSPLTRGTLALDGLVGLWPLEDASGSGQLSQAMPGLQAGTYSGTVTLGAEESPGGAARSVQIGSGAALAGAFLSSSASGWQVSFSVKLSSTPATTTHESLFTWTDTAGRTWQWMANDASFKFYVTASDGTVLSDENVSYTSQPPTDWIRCCVKATVSAGTLTYEPAWYAEGAPSIWGVTRTFSATSTGQLRAWRIRQNDHNTGANYVNVFGLDDTTVEIILDGSVLAAFNGHVGELAGVRFARLMTEHGLGYTLTGPFSTATLGAQPAEPLSELMREIRDTEDGLIYDQIDAIEIEFRRIQGRYNQTAASIDVSELPMPPDDVTDDLGIHNLVTVANRSGAEATAEDSTGPLGTQDPPDGVGRAEQTVDTNHDDDTALPQWATWWLRRGTVNLPRYPTVTVNLAALDAARAAEIEGVDIGEVIEITGYRENTIRLHVLGYTETIGWPTARTITFTCAPDQQFVVGIYDDTESRYDLRTCTMSTAAGPTATTMTLAITDDEAWSTTSAYDLLISGELVGVPAGGMGARTGSAGAYTQTITGAVRSKNGVRKTLPAGAEVHVATPGRWALS